MTKTTLKRSLTLFSLVIVVLTACATQAPIAVYITPTAPTSLDGAAGPTEISEASSLGFTLTSIQSVATTEPHPTVTWQGPVIGPGYELPQTNTPMPTTPPPTVAGQPTAAPAASAVPDTASSQVTIPGGLPDLDPSKMGIQAEGNLEQSDWDDVMRRVGSDQLDVGWFKLQIPWKDMQPNNATEISPFFQRIILYLQDAKRRHLHIILSVAKAPAWARSTQDQDGPPDDPQTYANFLTFLLQQVNAGATEPVIDAIEIWNEPNLVREWTGKLPFTGAGYMQLFNAGYKALRAYSSSIQIISAGLSPTGDNPGTVDDRVFLQQMYAAGLGNYHDIGIGIHPYGWANPPDAKCCSNTGWDDNPHFFFADTIADYRQMMVSNGQSDLKLWVTEFGWATWEGFPGQPPSGSEWMLRNDKWKQANYTMRAFQIGQQTDYIGPMILWNLNFATLAGLIENNDERIAYSIELPGANGQIDNHSKDRTERPLYWMIYDAVRPDVNLPKYD
ncbi:MAG: hypothetical protein GC204_18060 [Chloroflexi bacterium]|nr:hypothetical protein [Chloroflexota bacterium]